MCQTVQKTGARREVMFHQRFRCVPVVVRLSGENFPTPLGQFQSIGPKKFQIRQHDQHRDYRCQKGAKSAQTTTTGDGRVSSVTGTPTTCAKNVSKVRQNIENLSELVFHPRFGGVPVVERPSGENFPSPLGQFQSIGQKNFRFQYRTSPMHNNYHFLTSLPHLMKS